MNLAIYRKLKFLTDMISDIFSGILLFCFITAFFACVISRRLKIDFSELFAIHHVTFFIATGFVNIIFAGGGRR